MSKERSDQGKEVVVLSAHPAANQESTKADEEEGGHNHGYFVVIHEPIQGFLSYFVNIHSTI